MSLICIGKIAFTFGIPLSGFRPSSSDYQIQGVCVLTVTQCQIARSSVYDNLLFLSCLNLQEFVLIHQPHEIFLQGIYPPALELAFRNREKWDQAVLTLTCMLCLSSGVFYFGLRHVFECGRGEAVTLKIRPEL